MGHSASSAGLAYNAPRTPTPPGACDCHLHVLGPRARFPYVPGGRYIPATDVPLEDCLAMHDELGITRGVLVQSSSYGTDNRAMLDALARHPTRLRGVGVVSADVAVHELQAMHALGVRGLRFKQFPVAAGHRAVADLDALQRLAGPMRELGWHAQLWTDPAVLPQAEPMLRRLGVPLVFDHMGQPRIEQGIDDPAFRILLGLLADGVGWVKLSAVYRAGGMDSSRANPAWPFHDALLRANPQHALWGSDWPHPHTVGPTPDAGALLDILSAWTDDASRRRILVDNPAQLYGFDA
jgi:predicted TIM-barrel fold metal-dependent hydrolase